MAAEKQLTKIAKLVATEFAAVFLWVVSSFALYIVTVSPSLLQSLTPTVDMDIFPPIQVFLTALIGLMAIWEFLGLWFDSPANPACTLSLYVAHRLPLQKAILLSVSQFLAHIAAVPFVRYPMQYYFSTAEDLFAPPQPRGISFPIATAIEATITAVFCLVALSVKHIVRKEDKFKTWVITTSTLLFMMVLTLDWTGGCMNPAMSLALAIVHRQWSAQIVYWIGPLFGAVVAGLLYNAVFVRDSARLSLNARRKIVRASRRHSHGKLE